MIKGNLKNIATKLMVTVKCNFLDSLVQYLVFFVYFVFFFNLFDFSKIFFI